MAQLKVSWAVPLAIINGVIAGLTYIATGSTPITAVVVIMGVVTGVEAAIHYEEQTPASTS